MLDHSRSLFSLFIFCVKTDLYQFVLFDICMDVCLYVCMFACLHVIHVNRIDYVIHHIVLLIFIVLAHFFPVIPYLIFPYLTLCCIVLLRLHHHHRTPIDLET